MVVKTSKSASQLREILIDYQNAFADTLSSTSW